MAPEGEFAEAIPSDAGQFNKREIHTEFITYHMSHKMSQV